MSMTLAEAHAVTRSFLGDYPGGLALVYRFGETAADLFGSRAAEVPAGMKGGYLPKPQTVDGREFKGRVDLLIGNTADAQDLVVTLRHEVLGHYGANTFTPGDKRSLIDAIRVSQEQPSLKPLWQDINSRYAGASFDVRAEEVFALVCEGLDPRQHERPGVKQQGEQAFAETCIARVRPLEADDLHNIASMVAQGIRDRTRSQQNFPQFNVQFRKDETMEPKKPFHEVVAEKLIEQLKAGTAPWQKPWEPGEPNAHLPMNPTTGKRYKGINAIHLMAQGRDDERWMTYKQAAAVGAQVRKGEKGTPVQYWKFSDQQDKLDDNGRPVFDAKGEAVKETVMLERPRVFFATVFNGTQIDGLPPREPKKEQSWNAVDRAEHILQASGATLTHAAGDRAFYRPSTDSITLPERNQFPSADRYYATALHELGHWTGHASRLDRDLAHPFGSQGYAKEELRAEIASMILGDELGIGHDPGQHAAYVGSWIKALQDEPLEVFRAAADAEKIHDYVLAFEQKQVLDQSQQNRQAQDFGTAQAQALAVDVTEVLENSGLNFNHYQAFQGDSLEDALRSRGLETVGSVTGNDPEQFYAVAHERLSPVFGIDPSHTETDNAYLERKGLAQEFANKAEQLHQAVQQAAVVDQEASMNTPTNDQAAGLLAAHPADAANGIERAADARRQLAAGEIDGETFAAATRQHLGVELPPDWSGELRIVGVAERDGQTVDAAQAGIDPQAFQVYARKTDAQFGEDAFSFVAGTRTETQAETLAERLRLVDALGTNDQHERAAKLARVQEDRVRRDPSASEEEVSAAKEARQAAEASALVNETDAARRAAEADRQNRDAQQPDRQYISVPFKEKDEAKRLGARWDRQEQSWYVPAGVEPSPFAKWAQEAPRTAAEPRSAQDAPHGRDEPLKAAQQAVQPRQYLAVPYEHRNEAKTAGAHWDKAAKSWYAGPNADLGKLDRWRPENVKAEQAPAMTPRDEFAESMRSAGLFVGSNAQGDHPVMDGKRHRVPVDGGKKGALDGFYVGHLDGHPAGRIINNKTGADLTWKSKGYALSDQDKAKLQADAAAKLVERAEEQRRAQEATAERVGRQLTDLTPVQDSTTYLKAKGVKAFPGVLTDSQGEKTYIPAFDADGKQWTMQYIQEDGTKRFAKDSKKEGCFHPVGGLDALAAAPVLLIAEGYATAAQLAEAAGHATVAAFDSGNLEAVAKALHAKFPEKPVFIAGDDDRHLVMTHGSNPGRDKAQAAAQAVGGKAIFPIFAPEEHAFPKDVPAVTPEAFKAHLRAEAALSQEDGGKPALGVEQEKKLAAAILSSNQLDALARMKKNTDFNDLAANSELGKEGVRRQLSAALSQTRSVDTPAQEQRLKHQRQAAVEVQPRRSVRMG